MVQGIDSQIICDIRSCPNYINLKSHDPNISISSTPKPTWRRPWLAPPTPSQWGRQSQAGGRCPRRHPTRRREAPLLPPLPRQSHPAAGWAGRRSQLGYHQMPTKRVVRCIMSKYTSRVQILAIDTMISPRLRCSRARQLLRYAVFVIDDHYPQIIVRADSRHTS